MHVIFGISALVMLGGTIWMLAKDHNREWRKWQLDDRAREALDDRSPVGPGRGRFDRRSWNDLQEELLAAQSTKIDAEPWSSSSSSWCRPRTRG